MLYSNEKKTLKGKVWRLPNTYWRACNYKGQQCTFKLWNEAKRFAEKGLNEGPTGATMEQVRNRAQQLYKGRPGATQISLVKQLQKEFPDADYAVIEFIVHQIMTSKRPGGREPTNPYSVGPSTYIGTGRYTGD